MLHTNNQAQQSAIEHGEGPIQVLAGPGSGKTYTIVKRIRYLVEKLKVPPERILVITFTKAAAKEMQSRFLTEIRRSYSAVHFGTFHSVYYQILSRSGYARNFSLVTEGEKIKIVKALLQQSFPEKNISYQECTEVLHEIGRLKNREEESGGYEKIQAIYEEYCEMLQQAGKMDFDDMIVNCYEILCQNKVLREEWQQYFSHILVDEFQDINRLQYQVLKLLAAPENRLFTVGDDDQSIYGFRGAKPEVMKEFLVDYPDCTQILLDINYRSTHSIVTASGQVIACNRQRLVKTWRALREGSNVISRSFPEREKEDAFLLEQLSALSAEESRECAVILRTNQEASLLAMKCLEAGIPVRVSEKRKDIFAHFIGLDLLDYIQFACQEKSRERFLNICNKPMRYLSRKSVADLIGEVSREALLEYYGGRGDAQREINRLFADCQRIARMSPYLAIQYIRKGIGYDRYLKERARPGEYEEWTEIANSVQESAKNCQTTDQWLERIKEYQRLCQQTGHRLGSSGDGSDSFLPEEEKRQEGIRLLTMHGSKGLEFQRVYLPHLNEGILPGKKAKTPEQIEEERRLFYVAMTRAKEMLFLSYAASSQNIPSRFLEPLIKK